MVSNKTKKAICIAVALSLMANLSPQVYAGDLVAFPQNSTSVVIPQNSSIIQSNSTNFSMKSIESKMSNILNPAKKEGGNKVNRKQLDTYSSTCGTNVKWSLDTSTGVLTISGSGAMNDYSYSSNSPWFLYRSSITSLVIENGVNSIGKLAFRGCSDLTSVTIPDSVTSIGEMAFSGCSGLTSVTIPSSVTSIGDNVFFGCSAMTSISVNSSNPNYKSINGILYSKDETELIQCPSGRTEDVTIPSSVTSIGSDAFRGCSKLTSVTIPSSVTSIGSDAFYACSSLTSVTIPSSVTLIGIYVFYDCSSLTSVTIPSSVTSITSYTFRGCSKLTSVTIPSSVTSIGSYAFSECTGLTSVTYTGTTEPKFYSNSFSNCDNLTEVEVSNKYKKDTFCNIPVNRSLTVVSLCGDGKQQYFDSNAKKIIVYKKPTNRCKYQPRSFTMFDIRLLSI